MSARARRQTTQERPAERIQVRQVTHVQPTWTEGDRGADGAFTLQLILDQGADEYMLRPSAADLEVLLELLDRAENAFFDVERKVLMFGNRQVGA